MLSKGAFNALLTTIEEPPKHVIFLFATTESDKIPATIISRCQRYDFKRIPIDLISGRLREVCGKSGIKASDDALRLIASRSDGALRDALSLLDQISAISGNENEISSQDVERITGTVDSSFLFKMANCLIDARFDELIDLCEILNSSGKNQARFTLDLAAYFRDLLIIRVKADPIIYLPYPQETIKDMYQTASKVSADTLTGYISYLSKEYAELRKSPDIPTSFELMLMRLCGRKSSLPVTPIVIPDFERKQAAMASSVSFDRPDTVKPAEVKEEAPEGKTETPAASDKPQESRPVFTAPEPYRPKPSASASGILSFTSLAKEEKEIKEDTAVKDVKDDIKEPVKEEPEEKPSLFSFMSGEREEPQEQKPVFSFLNKESGPSLPEEPDEPDEPDESTKKYTLKDLIYDKWPTSGKISVKKGKTEDLLLFVKKDMKKLVKKVTYKFTTGKSRVKSVEAYNLSKSTYSDGYVYMLSFKGKKKGAVKVKISLKLKNGQTLSYTFKGKVK